MSENKSFRLTSSKDEVGLCFNSTANVIHRTNKKSGRTVQVEKRPKFDDSSDEENDELKAIGFYDYQTQEIRIRLKKTVSFKPTSVRLFYFGSIFTEPIVQDLNDDVFSSSRFLKIYIENVDRHVLYKTFTLIYSFVHADNNESEEMFSYSYEIKLQFEVRI